MVLILVSNWFSEMAEGGKGRRPMKPVPPWVDSKARGGDDGFPLAAGRIYLVGGAAAAPQLICLFSQRHHGAARR
jgi:hypothetical protein